MADRHRHALINDHGHHHHRSLIHSGADDRTAITTARPNITLIEQRIAAQHRDIQSLLFDNQRLAAANIALKQELAVAQLDLQHLSAASGEIKAERDAQVREVYEKSLKIEADVRLIDVMNAELNQVRVDAQKLSKEKQELTEELQNIDNDLEKSRLELEQLPELKADVENLHKEILRGRAAIEYEKKTHGSNLEHSKAMEKNMINMAREIEKLRTDLANAEQRARAAGAAAAAAANTSGAGFGANYVSTDTGYMVHPYVDPYAIAMPQAPVGADGISQYGHGALQNGPYGVQPPPPNVHR